MSTSSSKLELNFRPDGTLQTPCWKQELNERLAATRARRSQRVEEHGSLPSLDRFTAKQESRTSRLAAKVAERYANAPSYSEMLAAEARAAAEAAEAAVTAAQEARDRAHALLAGLETPAETAAARRAEAASGASGLNRSAGRAEGNFAAAAHTEAREMELLPDETPHERGGFAAGTYATPGELAEEAISTSAEPLPVNLIEFPRELVAPRRARPRLEEGPLRESFDETGSGNQLRIYEAEQRSAPAVTETSHPAAEWSSIRLDAKPSPAAVAEESAIAAEFPLKVASLEDRLLAGIFDAALVFLAFVLFVLVFVACTAHPPTGKPALFAAAAVLAGLCMLYQYLFFKFAEGTPGMRYAKIALCTFGDENPTRSAMRRRIAFLLLSAAPLGLGLAWAWFDHDRLAWHDRLTRMYQRSYR